MVVSQLNRWESVTLTISEGVLQFRWRATDVIVCGQRRAGVGCGTRERGLDAKAFSAGMGYLTHGLCLLIKFNFFKMEI